MNKFFSILLTLIILTTSISVCANGNLDVTGVSATGISKLAGELEVSFATELDPTTLKGNVSLAESVSGAATPIAVTLKDGDEQVVVVKYGDLEEGKTYNLTFGTGLSSKVGGLTPAENIVIPLTTSETVYRVKEDFQSYSADDTYSAKTSGLEDGEMYRTGSGTIKSNNGYNYVEYSASANTLLGDHYLNGNSSSPLITEDFAIDFEFKDVEASTGATGRNFTIAPDTYANDANGNNNSFTIMPSTTAVRTKLQLADSTKTNPKIVMAASQPTELNLYENEYGLNTVKIAGHMGSDGHFDLELSSENTANPNNSIKVDFTKFPSYGSFRSRIQSGKTHWGKMYVYKITPIDVLDTYTDSEYLYVVMNDDIAKFSSNSPVFTKANYNAASRTFKVSLGDLEEGDQEYSFADLRTNDGAFGNGKINVYVQPVFSINTQISNEISVSRSGGQLEILFNKDVDPDSLTGNVHLKLAGTDLDVNNDVGLTAAVDENDSKKVVIAWSELEANKTYTLTFDGNEDGSDAVKALAGNCWLLENKNITLVTNTKLNVVTDISEELSIGRIDGKIEVEFDKAIDESCLENSVYLTKVGDSNRTDINVSVSNTAPDTVVAEWEKLDADSTYILTFGGSADGENAVKAAASEGEFWLLENETVRFNTNAIINADSSVKESYSIGKVAGEIKVTFDREIDESTLSGNIRLEIEGGADVTDTVGVSAAVDTGNPKAIVVAYGELEDNLTYILTFKGAANGDEADVNCIKSPDAEYWLHSDKTVKLITDIDIYQAYISRYTLSESVFDNLEPGEEFSSDDPNLVLQSTFETNTPSTKDIHAGSVSASGKTLKYIALGTDGTIVRDSFYGYKFPTAITDKEIALDLICQTVGIPASRSVRTGSVTIHSMAKETGASADEFGFSHIRYVFTKASDGKYVVNGYDMLNSSDIPIVTKNTGLTSISDIKCQQYEFEANLNSGRYFNIAGFKVSEYASPKVNTAETSLENVQRSANEMIVKFTVPVVRTSIKADSLKIVDSAGKDVMFEFMPLDKNHPVNNNVSQADTLGAKLVLKEYLKPGKEYTIKFSNLKSILGYTSTANDSYTFTAGGTGVKVNNVIFKNAGGSTINQLTQEDTAVSATVNLVSEDGLTKNVRIFLAIYDESGMIYKLAENTGTIGSAANDLTVTLTDIKVKNGSYVKCFVWQNTLSEQRVSLFEDATIRNNDNNGVMDE